MIGVIIQARMGSSRLPGKILMDFCGMTLIEHIVDRLSKSEIEFEAVIATSILGRDDIVEEHCKSIGVECYRGDELNVLKRYHDCARQYGFTDIVRMTADNPFPDIAEFDRLIEYHISNDLDFTENYSVLPIGVGMEIMSLSALNESMDKAFLPKHFEHADEYILDNIDSFRHGTIDVADSKRFPDVRLTVDTEEDYEKAVYILSNSVGYDLTTERAIELCRKYEEKL